MNRGKLIVTVGAPGSGKSTMMDKLFGAPNVLRLERDRFREALYGSRRQYWDMAGKSEELHSKMSLVVGSSMFQAMAVALEYRLHSTVVLSDTGFGWNAVKRFIGLARRHRLTVEVYLFDVPKHVLIQRNQSRQQDHRIPHELLMDAFNKIHDVAEEPHDRWWLDPARCDRLTKFNEFGEIMK